MSEPRDAPAHYDNAQASAWADGYESGRAAGGQPPSDGPPSEKARDAFSAAFFTECILRHAEGRVMEGDVLAKAIDLGLVAAYKVDHGR